MTVVTNAAEDVTAVARGLVIALAMEGATGLLVMMMMTCGDMHVTK